MAITLPFSFLIILWPIIKYFFYRSLYLCTLQNFTVSGVQFCLKRNARNFWNPCRFMKEEFLGRENGKCKGPGVRVQQEGWLRWNEMGEVERDRLSQEEGHVGLLKAH